MKLYFTRHGKTEWNKEMRFQGLTGDSPLLPESFIEISALGRYLSEVSFEGIYSSPQTRAKMTAEGIVQELITQTNITWSDELKELSVGELEGQPIKVGKEKYPEEMHFLRQDPSQYDPSAFKGEPYEDMLKRSVGFVQQKVETSEDGPLLFVSHGATLVGLIQTLIGTPLAEVRNKGSLSNNSLTIVDYSEGEYTLEVWDDVSFLD